MKPMTGNALSKVVQVTVECERSHFEYRTPKCIEEGLDSDKPFLHGQLIGS